VKVLFVTRSNIGLSKGGLRRKIDLISEGLHNRGVEVIWYDPWQYQIDSVDVCHFFSTGIEMYPYMETARKRGKPIIISPVFSYFDTPLQIMLKVRLAHIVPGFCYHYVILKRMLLLADRILCLTEEGAAQIGFIMGIHGGSITVVPNGVDMSFSQADSRLFENRYGIRNFVVQVGVIDPNKNHLTIIKAMANLPYKYVIIGEPVLGHEAYMKQCQSIAGKNVLFIDKLGYNDPMLASAYKAAKVFIMPSYSETWGQTIYQAALAGCSVIVSRNIPLSPHIRNYVSRANPDSPRQFRKLIEQAMHSKTDERLRQAVLSMMTWQDVADQIITIYKDVMQGR
jgi:glycosyltransferase involved in cell wall biosynthesis